MLRDWLTLRTIVPGIYLVFVTRLIVIGLECCAELGNHDNYLYWAFAGVFLLPWSLISLFLVLASLHAGDYGGVKMSLILGGIVNAILIHYLIRVLRPINPDE